MTTSVRLRDGSVVPQQIYEQTKSSIDHLFKERQERALFELFQKCKDESYQFSELFSAFNSQFDELIPAYSREILKKRELIQEDYNPLNPLNFCIKSSRNIQVNENVRKIVLNYLDLFNNSVARVNPLSSRFREESKKNQ